MIAIDGAAMINQHGFGRQHSSVNGDKVEALWPARQTARMRKNWKKASFISPVVALLPRLTRGARRIG